MNYVKTYTANPLIVIRVIVSNKYTYNPQQPVKNSFQNLTIIPALLVNVEESFILLLAKDVVYNM